MERNWPVSILGSAVVVSLAIVASIVTSTVVASRAYLRRGEQQNVQAQSLDVTGSARKRIVSDLALWTVAVAGEGKTLEEAFGRLNASAEQVRAFLAQQGIPEGAVSAGPIHTTTHYRRDDKGKETREVVAYQLSRRFLVRLADVGKVAKASGEVTGLIKSGAHVESLGPEYIYTGLADLKVAMIGEATADARERAERIAAGSRCRIGAVKEARAGVLQITPPWSTEVSSGGLNDTSSIEKDVTAVVHLKLAIGP
jgi:hypothetical protein